MTDEITEDEIDIYGLDKQPMEWFVRIHSIKGKKGAEEIKQEILQGQKLIKLVEEASKIKPIKFESFEYINKKFAEELLEKSKK